MALKERETCLNGDLSELMSSVTPELAVCLGPGSERGVHTYQLFVTGRIFFLCSIQNMYTQVPPGPSLVL